MGSNPSSPLWLTRSTIFNLEEDFETRRCDRYRTNFGQLSEGRFRMSQKKYMNRSQRKLNAELRRVSRRAAEALSDHRRHVLKRREERILDQKEAQADRSYFAR